MWVGSGRACGTDESRVGEEEELSDGQAESAREESTAEFPGSTDQSQEVSPATERHQMSYAISGIKGFIGLCCRD